MFACLVNTSFERAYVLPRRSDVVLTGRCSHEHGSKPANYADCVFVACSLMYIHRTVRKGGIVCLHESPYIKRLFFQAGRINVQ